MFVAVVATLIYAKYKKIATTTATPTTTYKFATIAATAAKKTHIKPAVALTTNNVWAIFCCYCSQSVSQPIVARTPLNVRRCRNGLSVGFLVAGSIGRMVNTAA